MSNYHRTPPGIDLATQPCVYCHAPHGWQDAAIVAANTAASERGYREAFYKIADTLGIGGAMPIPPAQFFESVMLPKLKELAASNASRLRVVSPSFTHAVGHQPAPSIDPVNPPPNKP